MSALRRDHPRPGWLPEWRWSHLPVLAGSIAGATGLVYVVEWLQGLSDAWGREDLSTAVLGADLNMFLGAGDLAAAGEWETVYSPTDFSNFVGSADMGASFAYPPPFAQLMSLVPDIEFASLAIGWAIVTAVIFFVAIPFLVGADALRFAAFMLLPIYAAAQLGQTTALAALIAAAAVRLIASGHESTGGVASGLLVYKVPLLAGPLGLSLTRRASRFGVGVFASVSLVTLGSMALSTRAWQEYLTGITTSGVNANVVTRWDLSLTAVLERFMEPLSALLAFALIVLPLIGWTVWSLRDSPIDETTLAIALLVSVLASPRMLVYDWAILAVPLTLLQRTIEGDRWIAIATGAVLLAPLIGLPSLRGLSQLAFGWLSLVWLLILVVRRSAPTGAENPCPSATSQ